jgi:hypothetical protein
VNNDKIDGVEAKRRKKDWLGMACKPYGERIEREERETRLF